MSSAALSTTSLRSVGQAKFLWIVALAVIVVAAITLPAFRSPVSVNSLLATLAPIVLIAVGQGIVVLFGGIDLSVGATAGLATVVLSLSPLLPGGTASALALVLVAGFTVGMANGAGIVAGVNPLLMTFATAGVVQGAALLIQATRRPRFPRSCSQSSARMSDRCLSWHSSPSSSSSASGYGWGRAAPVR